MGYNIFLCGIVALTICGLYFPEYPAGAAALLEANRFLLARLVVTGSVVTYAAKALSAWARYLVMRAKKRLFYKTLRDLNIALLVHATALSITLRDGSVMISFPHPLPPVDDFFFALFAHWRAQSQLLAQESLKHIIIEAIRLVSFAVSVSHLVSSGCTVARNRRTFMLDERTVVQGLIAIFLLFVTAWLTIGS